MLSGPDLLSDLSAAAVLTEEAVESDGERIWAGRGGGVVAAGGYHGAESRQVRRRRQRCQTPKYLDDVGRRTMKLLAYLAAFRKR